MIMMPVPMITVIINLDVRPAHINAMTIMLVPRIVVTRLRVVNTNKLIVTTKITALMIFAVPLLDATTHLFSVSLVPHVI
jgi:hypothetical protein